MNNKYTTNEQKLIQFVVGHTDSWRNWRDQNFVKRWDEYERLWRGIFDANDRQRASERSKVITPILQDAIDSYQAEIEEAIFGRNSFFDIIDDDENKLDTEEVKKKLQDNFKKDGIEEAISEIITLAAVYGTGIGELIVNEKVEKTPMTKEVASGFSMVGVGEKDRFSVSLVPVHPKNFLIDPNATNIEGALGCAIEEQVSIHSVIQNIEKGVYRDVEIGFDTPDQELGASQDITEFEHGKITVLRYYGLVPKAYIDNINSDVDALEQALETEGENETQYIESYEDLVEAIIVIGNGGTLLKAERNPYSMEDRPVVYFPCEKLPKRFYGRGIAEKGYNMQKAIDAQIRSHLDSLALTAAPMMGMDATRMPRGFKFEVYPGRTVLTNGSPREVLEPLQFGQTDPQLSQTAAIFERMLQKGTGTLDSSGLADAAAGGQARTGAVAMSLGGIIKKNRKALQSFQTFFLIPFIKKTAWRYMQFDPDNFPSKDYDFIPVSTLGIIAREYETQNLLNMASTLGPESPIVPLLLEGVIENSSLANRDTFLEALKKMSQPSPEQQQLNQQMQALQLAQMEATVQEGMARAAKEAALAEKAKMDAAKAQAEIQIMPEELRVQMIAALSKNSETESEFGQRIKLAETIQKDKELELKAADIASNERIAFAQIQASRAKKSA
jgi:hypothetical protein